MLSRSNLDAPIERKPAWLKVRAPSGPTPARIRSILRARGLHTVCEEARCPNVGECWGGGTATFMILGDVCTRACAFCAVKTGNPKGLVDPEEPEKVAEATHALGLRYVVLTTVDRDDLPDGGAEHFARTVRAIRRRSPRTLVETLTGDFQGRQDSIRHVLESEPAVFAHNVETVERLTPRVRDRRASYRRSLEVLETAKRLRPEGLTKSSLMVGVGERPAEVSRTLADLRAVGVDLVTIGQYLRPTPRHLPVVEFHPPERFEEWRREALEMGFLHCSSGPLVRSSYRAAEQFVERRLGPSRDERDGA